MPQFSKLGIRVLLIALLALSPLVVFAPSASATTYCPIGLASVLNRASYDDVYQSYNTPAVIAAQTNLISGTGDNAIRVDIGYDAWLYGDTATIAKIDSYVNSITSSGHTFVLADASAEYYRSHPLTWSDFQSAWISRAVTLAARYHPAYYIIVKEPGWYFPMISDQGTNPAVHDPYQWAVFTAYLAAYVKAASPNTQVGVSVPASPLYNNPLSFEWLYLYYTQGITNLNFQGFDEYDNNGLAGTDQYVTAYPTAKPYMTAETWGPNFNPTDDGNWLWYVYLYASSHHFLGMITFYSDYFASYSTPPTTESGLLSFYNQRSQVFTTMQQIVLYNLGLPHC